MSRMFRMITSTWNVYKGCHYDCAYCNAKEAAETRFRHIPRYKDGFTPKLVEKELNRTFKPGEFVFVAYMGDIAWARRDWTNRILDRIRCFPATNFLLMSKNPRYFQYWEGIFPPNVYLGTTIESNYNYGLSKAPSPILIFMGTQASQEVCQHRANHGL
jgi:hypothetical protein